MSLVGDIDTILASNQFNYPIYLTKMPMTNKLEEPVAFALISSGGRGRDKASGIDQPTFSVLVKGYDYEQTMEAVEQLEDIFHEVDETTVGDKVYMTFFQDSNPIDLGEDESERYTLTVNFRVMVRSI